MNIQDAEILKKLMMDNLKVTSKMQTDLTEIKVNLQHSVSNTSSLEQKVDQLDKDVTKAKGSIAVFGFLAVLVSIWKTIRS